MKNTAMSNHIMTSASSNTLATQEESGHDSEICGTALAVPATSFELRDVGEKKEKILEPTSRLRQRVEDKKNAQEEWKRLSYRLNANTPVRLGGV